jgi:hypothetical protein
MLTNPPLRPPAHRQDLLPPNFGSRGQFGNQILAKGEDLRIVLGEQGRPHYGILAIASPGKPWTLAVALGSLTWPGSSPFSRHVGGGIAG